MPNEKLKSYPLYRLTQKIYQTKNIVEIRCFLLPKTYNFIHNHRLVQNTLCDFLKGLERQFCPIFAPKNDRNKAVSIFPVVFLFSGGKED